MKAPFLRACLVCPASGHWPAASTASPSSPSRLRCATPQRWPRWFWTGCRRPRHAAASRWCLCLRWDTTRRPTLCSRGEAAADMAAATATANRWSLCRRVCCLCRSCSRCMCLATAWWATCPPICPHSLAPLFPCPLCPLCPPVAVRPFGQARQWLWQRRWHLRCCRRSWRTWSCRTTSSPVS